MFKNIKIFNSKYSFFTYSELSLRNFYIKIKFGFLDLKKRFSVQISSLHLIIEQEHFCTIILETLEKPKKINN